jgi:MarR family transcriptional regulator for hemolysin
MTGFDAWESIGFHCSLTYRSFVRAFEKRLHKTGITPAQFFALSHLTALGPMPQAELAAYLTTSPVSVVRLIDRMERDGWVKRKADTVDRRVKLVVPTAQAEAIWNELTDLMRVFLEHAYRGISEEELEGVKITLRRIRDNLET